MSSKAKVAIHLTESLEDYLEAIAELIAVEGHAHTKDIAERLHVKMPSVTGAIRQLEKMKYIVYNSHCPVVLTPEGKEIADNIIYRHRVLKEFFANVLGVSASRASDAACHIEHIVDEDTIRRFVIFSEAIENRCDAQRLRTFLSEAMYHLENPDTEALQVLTECQHGDQVRVEKFGRNLKESKALEIAVGDILVMDGLSLDKSSLRVLRDGHVKELLLADAENIWVRTVSGE